MGGQCRHAADARTQLFDSGTTPVSVLVGQLDATPRPPQSSDTPGVLALAMGVTPIKEFSVAPRALVPMNSKTQMSVGTAIRAEVSPACVVR